MVVWADIFPTEITIEVILKGLTRAIGIKRTQFSCYTLPHTSAGLTNISSSSSFFRTSTHLRTMLPFVHITFTLHVC